MKKSIYINKYDYIGYYTKPKQSWFFSNAEIKSKLAIQLKRYKSEIDDEDTFNDDDESNEFDSLSYYKELKFYREQVKENKNTDQNDPKILEGIILDEKSRSFIIDEMKKTYGITEFYDLETENTFDHSYLMKKTNDLLTSHPSIILFQPVFITNNLITKPDAFVKIDDNNYLLIETKGTTTSKRQYFLDLYFQYRVLRDYPILKNKNIDFNLCIVKYEKLKKNEVSFSLTEYFNVKKTGATVNEKVKSKLSQNSSLSSLSPLEEEKGKLKLGYISYLQVNEDELIDYNVDEQFLPGFSFLESFTNIASLVKEITEELSSINQNRSLKSYKETGDLIILTINQFDNVIKELTAVLNETSRNIYQGEMPLDFHPNLNDVSAWKNCDFLKELKEIYIHLGYQIYQYSGKVINLKNYYKKNYYLNKYLDIFKEPGIFKGDATKGIDIRQLFKDNKSLIDSTNTTRLFQSIKKKKVYFDFESINSAIRVFDYTLPFTQIVTQNSYIIDDGETKTEDFVCHNMMCDPTKVDVSFFKDIIDALYQGNDASYIVYNETFEKSRLKEMAKYINEVEYIKKVEIINKNVVDLAKFFTVSSKGYYLFYPELYGFYSIKKVLPLIYNKDNSVYFEAKCLDYKKLDVKNGLECQNMTTMRFFNQMTGEQWIEFMNNAKVYCENDVRAMVAVYLFIEKELKKRGLIN
ncbi:DUF2779 domain-containing protein [Ureaplasma canigenitalium]|uniref:DUF2779 domain-containing protein n=1 Tax=Ureaplasma canigenitalium TaxID=42092 RepID=UPI0004E251A7|nr:DUF2779 domain-containing protein [Ureaplasma canigenitalium]